MLIMKNVTIIQRVLPHYRVQLFKQLHQLLLENNVNMTLIYGQHKLGTVPETVNVDYEWAVYAPNRYINVMNVELVYQKLPVAVKKSDLVIIEQANRLLSNYILLAKRFVNGLKVAYWGHGMNFQANGSGWLKEKLKRFMLTKVDWWFAYTKLSADVVVLGGFPENNISILNNAIDNKSFKQALNNVTGEDISKLYEELGMQGSHVCLYCGGLYAEKQIDFLVKSSVRMRNDNPEFELVVIGSGPDQSKVEMASKKYEWFHYVGPKYGDERARYFKAAKLLLMPGPVGLVVLDSFISKKPLVTTDIAGHGPEISYLDHGKNGLMSSFDEVEYANAVNNCLLNEAVYIDLARGCELSALDYTMNNMVDNFKNGILDCLKK